MVTTLDRYTKKSVVFLLFLYLIAFPFGQIPGFIFNIYYPSLPTLHVSDFIIFLIALISLSSNKIKIFKDIRLYIFILSFISLFSVFYLNHFYLTGFLYLIRYSSYLLTIPAIIFAFKTDKDKKLLLDSLLIVIFFISMFGWIQYFLIPDLTSLKFLNWDDHYYRLVGTFFDPTFTGILLVIGYVIAIYKYFENKKLPILLLSALFVLTVFFTYSRSSILTFTLVNLLIIVKKIKYKKIAFIFLILLSICTLFLLPKSTGGEGVNLLRTNSIYQKIENNSQAINLISENILFGVGYNNVCSVKMGQNEIKEFSHSCAGFDNSFLFVLATTGIVGIIYFIYFYIKTIQNTSLDYFGEIYHASLFSVFLHGLFTNTYFYSWVIGIIFMLLAISRKNTSE